LKASDLHLEIKAEKEVVKREPEKGQEVWWGMVGRTRKEMLCAQRQSDFSKASKSRESRLIEVETQPVGK